MERDGFEPPRIVSTGLQPVPFSHSGTVPWSHLPELHQRPGLYKGPALLTELRWQNLVSNYLQFVASVNKTLNSSSKDLDTRPMKSTDSMVSIVMISSPMISLIRPREETYALKLSKEYDRFHVSARSTKEITLSMVLIYHGSSLPCTGGGRRI